MFTVQYSLIYNKFHCLLRFSILSVTMQAKVFPVVMQKEEKKNEAVDGSMEPQNQVKDLRCPCLCKALTLTIFVYKIFGILPIKEQQKSVHYGSCTFIISQFWLYFSYGIQSIYVMYMLVTYISRLICGPDSSGLEW